MERLLRLVLWIIMLVLAGVVFVKGHGKSCNAVPVAFFRAHESGIVLRLQGNCVNPGVYTFPRKSDVASVTKVTVPDARFKGVEGKLLRTELHSGDILEINIESSQHVDITVKKMRAREMVLLGIPLDPNSMSVDDWDSLPGIGPVLAERIVRDRQKYGEFKSFRDLSRVSGLGEISVNKLSKYFK